LGVANELTHTHLTKNVLRGLGIQNEQLGVPLMRLITCYMMRSLMKSAIWFRAEKVGLKTSESWCLQFAQMH
jgi:hypothetical protein